MRRWARNSASASAIFSGCISGEPRGFAHGGHSRRHSPGGSRVKQGGLRVGLQQRARGDQLTGNSLRRRLGQASQLATDSWVELIRTHPRRELRDDNSRQRRPLLTNRRWTANPLARSELSTLRRGALHVLVPIPARTRSDDPIARTRGSRAAGSRPVASHDFQWSGRRLHCLAPETLGSGPGGAQTALPHWRARHAGQQDDRGQAVLSDWKYLRRTAGWDAGAHLTCQAAHCAVDHPGALTDPPDKDGLDVQKRPVAADARCVRNDRVCPNDLLGRCGPPKANARGDRSRNSYGWRPLRRGPTFWGPRGSRSRPHGDSGRDTPVYYVQLPADCVQLRLQNGFPNQKGQRYGRPAVRCRAQSPASSRRALERVVRLPTCRRTAHRQPYYLQTYPPEKYWLHCRKNVCVPGVPDALLSRSRSSAMINPASIHARCIPEQIISGTVKDDPADVKMSGGDLLSHEVTLAVPSAQKGLASGFGMVPGVSLSP